MPILHPLDLQPQTRITRPGELMIPIRNRPRLGAIPDQADLVAVPIFPLDMNEFLAGGTPPITWSATGLPTGLTIGSTNGIVSGTPTVDATFEPTVTATNGAGSNSSTFVWIITP